MLALPPAALAQVRVLGCLVLGIFYVYDVATLDIATYDSELGWALYLCVSVSLVAYWIILSLSIYWYVHDVLGEVHKEFKMKMGPGYWKRWCPCFVCCDGGNGNGNGGRKGAAEPSSDVNTFSAATRSAV